MRTGTEEHVPELCFCVDTVPHPRTLIDFRMAVVVELAILSQQHGRWRSVAKVGSADGFKAAKTDSDGVSGTPVSTSYPAQQVSD